MGYGLGWSGLADFNDEAEIVEVIVTLVLDAIDANKLFVVVNSMSGYRVAVISWIVAQQLATCIVEEFQLSEIMLIRSLNLANFLILVKVVLHWMLSASQAIFLKHGRDSPI